MEGAVILSQILTVTANIFFYDDKLPLSKPCNVTFTLINKESAILTWESGNNQIPNISYTAEYKWGNTQFESKCIEVKELWCDFGELPSLFGCYTFRVRAHLKERASDWVTTKNLNLNTQLEVDPPAVSMILRDGVMELNIEDPEYSLSCFRVKSMAYYIKYWREQHENETWQTIQQRPVSLPVSVLPSERLCVQVRTLCAGVQFRRASRPSNRECRAYSPHGKPIHPSAALIGCLATLAVFPVLILSWCVYKGRNFLYPNAALPHQLRQHPMETSADMPPVLQTEEQYERITSMSEPLCDRDRSVCQEITAGELSDRQSSVSVYESLIVCMNGEIVFRRMVEPTDISGRPEQRYYNMRS
ncbi:hypothetical protein ACEWY4_014531 [Coilia grayii]|uniref:Fibronectin type-III domain-containing protein n=1 Tax=Coilia grayii TaxID=363190 RepID=A0ABD1JSJ0_9TELE